MKVHTDLNYFIIMFSSVYMCSTSLKLINQIMLENKEAPVILNVLNGLSLVISGSVFIYNALY